MLKPGVLGDVVTENTLQSPKAESGSFDYNSKYGFTLHLESDTGMHCNAIFRDT